MKDQIIELFNQQLLEWDTARNFYAALNEVKVKETEVNGSKYQIQFNPARIVSSGAKVDAKTIQERKCFLCSANRPAVQKGIDFNGHYTILINPFPIFPKHFTIVEKEHTEQLILPRFGDMLDLAKAMEDYAIFYNGPKCGASAPDHAHFQAGNKGFLPLEKEWENHVTEKISDNLFAINYGFPAFVIKEKITNKAEAVSLFGKTYQALPVKDDETEPMMNVVAWYETSATGGEGTVVAVVIPRAKHRPDCYFAEGDENILISPAAVDLGGVFITPLEKDFEKITDKNVAEILGEVCLDKSAADKLTAKLKELSL
ncbi:MAG: hypothetical protein H6Q19_1641 [Bacteroidetes bacterium]|nr:hypothetical protein [Bacteroidota bacterium]